MNNLNINVPLTIFLAGAILFLLAPLKLFDSYTISEIFTTGLFIEMVGITASLAVFYINKINGKTMEEI